MSQWLASDPPSHLTSDIELPVILSTGGCVIPTAVVDNNISRTAQFIILHLPVTPSLLSPNFLSVP